MWFTHFFNVLEKKFNFEVKFVFPTIIVFVGRCEPFFSFRYGRYTDIFWMNFFTSMILFFNFRLVFMVSDDYLLLRCLFCHFGLLFGVNLSNEIDRFYLECIRHLLCLFSILQKLVLFELSEVADFGLGGKIEETLLLGLPFQIESFLNI